MQDKIDSAYLPKELWVEIVKKLPRATDIFNFFCTSKTNQVLSVEELNDRKKTHTFLQHVVQGDEEQIIAMLKENIELLFKREQVKDLSGRVFFEISGFEYALWTLDKDMWSLMLECVLDSKDSKAVIARLLSQYETMETKGVTYTLYEKTITEVHFNFKETIIKELETHVDLFQSFVDWNLINTQWVQGVGGAEKLLPLHAVYWYCCIIPFNPIPNFSEQKPPRIRQFFNSMTKKSEDWFHSMLGVEFAIYKSRLCGQSVGIPNAGAGVTPYTGLDAMKALYAARKNDFHNLKQQLQELLLVENQPTAAYI